MIHNNCFDITEVVMIVMIKLLPPCFQLITPQLPNYYLALKVLPKNTISCFITTQILPKTTKYYTK